MDLNQWPAVCSQMRQPWAVPPSANVVVSDSGYVLSCAQQSYKVLPGMLFRLGLLEAARPASLQFYLPAKQATDSLSLAASLPFLEWDGHL